MYVSVLQKVFSTERLRQQRCGGSLESGFSVPVIQEQFVECDPPYLAANSVGDLVSVRRSSKGYVRSAFFSCPLPSEGPLLAKLFNELIILSKSSDWGNRASSIDGAIGYMRSVGVEPQSLVVPLDYFKGKTPEELDRATLSNGFADKLDEIRVFHGPLGPGEALLLSAPNSVCSYTRVNNYLSLLFLRPDRHICLVK